MENCFFFFLTGSQNPYKKKKKKTLEIYLQSQKLSKTKETTQRWIYFNWPVRDLPSIPIGLVRFRVKSWTCWWFLSVAAPEVLCSKRKSTHKKILPDDHKAQARRLGGNFSDDPATPFWLPPTELRWASILCSNQLLQAAFKDLARSCEWVCHFFVWESAFRFGRRT